MLALPARAQLTGISRIQALGLDYGPRLPVRFVIEGPLHLAFDNVFLHRTKRLPPVDEVGGKPGGGVHLLLRSARTIDAIKVGDWLLQHGHMTLQSLSSLASGELWRPGADEALWVSPHLDGRSLSLRESETRSIINFAGLPQPEVNAAVDVGEGAHAFGDLVYKSWRTVVEYEGRQHQEDRHQYSSDLDRYALFRDHGHRYVQITGEHLRNPRVAVRRVYGGLVKAGYDGPAPLFGYQWKLLFSSLRVAVGPRDRWANSA